MARGMVQGFSELEKQFNELNKRLEASDVDKFCRIVAKELAARLLAQVIRRTPVGDYPASTGKKGGTLRRGWTAKTEEEAASGSGKGADAVAYANALPITKSGNVYEIEIINPVHYASYVEFGHRTRGGDGWVQGRFMLTLSEKEVQRQSAKVVEAKLQKYLGEVFNGR
jgi:CRISPR/Cas system CMR subunit Cmr6 (Cas7 group RAMP superfamily)